MYISILNSFRVIRCLSECVSPKIAIFTFLFPLGTPLGAIMQYVAWMESKFDAYKLYRRMYPLIFNSLPVIRTTSVKNRRFHVPQPTFLFPLETPLRLSRKSKNRYFYHFCFPWRRPQGNHAKCCMDGKRIRCLQIVSQYVPIYLQQFPSYSNRKCKKNRCFHVPQPTYLFPLETPLRLSRNMLHGWKDNSMLAKPSQHVPIYLQ